MSNDAQLAQQYGKTLSIFQKNKAAVDFEQMNYSYAKLHETTQDSGSDKSMELTIHNPCGLKIRPISETHKNSESTPTATAWMSG